MALSPKSLARLSARRPKTVLAVWVVGLIASFVVIGALLSSALSTEQDFTNNPEAKTGFELIEQRLRGPMAVTEALIIRSETLTVDDPAFRAYVEDLFARVTVLEGKYNGGTGTIVARGVHYYMTGDESLVSADRRTTLVSLMMRGEVDEATDNVGPMVKIVREADGRDGFEVLLSGSASINHDFIEVAESDLQKAELINLPIALLILVMVFGAVVAALVPMVLALFAIIAAVGMTAIIGQQFQFSFFVTNMILMMGLAVGIDYALFIVSRYREERGRGLSVEDAIGTAADTAGRAVFFSGITVIMALSGLLLVPTTIFRSLAGGAILVVLFAVIATMTLLPALLSLLGDRVNKLRIPVVQKAQDTYDEGRAGGFWDRIARTVMKHPVISVVTFTTLLLAAAIPYFDINLGLAGVSTLPDSFPSKKGFLILEQEFAGGQVAPAEVVIDGDVNSPAVQAAVGRLTGLLAAEPLFGQTRLEVNEAGDLAALTIAVAADPNSDAAMKAVRTLRDEFVPQAFDGVPVKTYVTGFTAFNQDFFDLTRQFTPIVFIFVLSLSFVLLTVVFRSIVVPVKSILLNLLSVGASYGLVVLVFQKGVGASLFGFQQVETIEAWLPLFLFAVLFGLSMDYHVFLLSRIREHYDETGDNAESVAFGLRSTGRLITGAALIMVAVFSGFARGDLVMFQQMGFGLAVSVLIDATIVRSILVPASMKILGNANWYLPPVLKWIPRIGIEAPARPPAAVPTAVSPAPVLSETSVGGGS
jgi:putative drug exporter of the RND superfamily